MKILYALVFVLSAFAAPAHTLDASTIAPCELDDCSLEVIELSMMPASAVASEPTIVKLEETDAAAITQPHNAEGGIAVGTIQPSDETQTGTMPAEIVANEPTIMKAGDAVDDADGVTITVVNDPEGVPVGASQPGDDPEGVPVGATQAGDEFRRGLLRFSQVKRRSRSLPRPLTRRKAS